MSPLTRSSLYPASDKQSISGSWQGHIWKEMIINDIQTMIFLLGRTPHTRTLSMVSNMMVAAPRPAAKASRHGEACPRFMAATRTPKNTWNKNTQTVFKLQFGKMRRRVACCLRRRYLQQRSRCVLLGVDDQSGAIPEGQGVAQEDDQPHVPGEETHDQTLPDAPSLSPVQVPVVPSQHDKQSIKRFCINPFQLSLRHTCPPPSSLPQRQQRF